MATIDTSYVRQELRAIADSSNAVKHLLRKALEELEQNPSSFPPLEEVPGNLTASYPNLTLRKIKLRSGKHNYRLVVAHWTLESGAEHADVLYCRQASGAWLGFGSYEVSVAGEPCRPTKDPGGSSCRTIWENRNCLAEWRSRPPPACLAGEQVLKAKRRFQYFFGTPASSPGR